MLPFEFLGTNSQAKHRLFSAAPISTSGFLSVFRLSWWFSCLERSLDLGWSNLCTMECTMVFPWMFASNWFLEKDVKRWFFWEQLGCRKPSHYLILQMWGCHHSLHPNCLATLVRSLWTCDGSRENHTKVSSWLMQSLKNCRSLKKCRSLNLRPHLMRKKPRCRLSLTDWVTSRTSWISFHHVSSQPGSFASSVVKHLDIH